MPLHDWNDDRGWESVHLLWLNQLLEWVQPRLPAGFRAYLGAVPALTIDAPNGRPDAGVGKWPADAMLPGVAAESALNKGNNALVRCSHATTGPEPHGFVANDSLSRSNSFERRSSRLGVIRHEL